MTATLKKYNQVKIGAILSYVQMGLQIVIGLLYTPVMIRLLGQNEYGLYNTVASTISTLSILKLGFNASYIRYYAKYKKNDDIDKINRLNGLFLIIFLIIGLIAFICGFYLTLNLHIVFSTGLTDTEYFKAKILMLLLTFNLATSFPMSVFSSIISAHEKFIFQKLLGICGTIVNPFITLPLLLMGYKSIAMVIVSVVISLVSEIINVFFVFKVLKNKFIFHRFEKGLFKSLFTFSVFIALNMIVDQINWNIDKILLGRFCGTAEVAVYSVGYSLYSYYQTFSSSISGVFTPRIHKIVNESNNILDMKKKLTELFVKVGRIQFIILALLATGILFFGRFFIINIWAGKEYENAYYVALLLVIPATIPLIQNLGIEIQRAENKHQFRSYIYTVMALLNLIMSIYLCQKYGAIGSAIGTSISLIVANGIIMNIFYHKVCYINIIEFWKNMFSISKSVILAIILGIILQNILDYNVIWKMFVGIILYIIIYCIVMWLFGLNDYEKSLFIKLFSKVKK